MSDTKTAILADETLTVVLLAIKDLHKLFGADLGAFDAGNVDKQRTVLSRCYNAIEATELSKRSAMVNEARAKVDAVISAKRAEVLTASAEIAKLSPAVRAALGVKLPENLLVSLSDVQGCFAQGTSETDMVKSLHDMGYSLAKGAKGDKGVRLSVPVTPKAAA